MDLECHKAAHGWTACGLNFMPPLSKNKQTKKESKKKQRKKKESKKKEKGTVREKTCLRLAYPLPILLQRGLGDAARL